MNTTITPIPLNLPGKLYRSPMPFSKTYDPDQVIYPEYQAKGVTAVVILAGPEECQEKAGLDLRQRYQADGLQIIDLPIPDYSTPDLEAMRQSVDQAIDLLHKGEVVAVHCHAGLGRTGSFLACLVKKTNQLSGDEAFRFVRQYIPGAVETSAQRAMLDLF